MSDFARAEAIAFNRDLDDFMRKETASEKRDNWVEEQVKILMSPDGEYYPFRRKNFEEAIAELNSAQCLLLNVYFSSAYEVDSENYAINAMAVTQFNKCIEDYWRKMATFEAERQYDKGDCQ